MSVKLLTEHHLEFLILKGGCRGSSESTLVKLPHCWKSHIAGQLYLSYPLVINEGSILAPFVYYLILTLTFVKEDFCMHLKVHVYTLYILHDNKTLPFFIKTGK